MITQSQIENPPPLDTWPALIPYGGQPSLPDRVYTNKLQRRAAEIVLHSAAWGAVAKVDPDELSYISKRDRHNLNGARYFVEYYQVRLTPKGPIELSYVWRVLHCKALGARAELLDTSVEYANDALSNEIASLYGVKLTEEVKRARVYTRVARHKFTCKAVLTEERITRSFVEAYKGQSNLFEFEGMTAGQRRIVERFPSFTKAIQAHPASFWDGYFITCEIVSKAFGGIYFVTATSRTPFCPRAFTVHKITKREVEIVGQCGMFPDLDFACEYIGRLLDETDPNYCRVCCDPDSRTTSDTLSCGWCSKTGIETLD